MSLVTVTERQWLLHAANARRIADQMADPSSRRTLLLVARAYELTAQHGGRVDDQWLCAEAAEFPVPGDKE
jgi:hypothetical protein